MMGGYDRSLEDALLKTVEDSYLQQSALMESGQPVEDYRESVGYLRALRDVRYWLKQIKENVQKG